jgi:hypothetical protein
MSTPASLDLRPFTVGEILDRALRIHRGNFRKLFIVMLAFQLPVYVMTKSFEYFGYDYFPHFLRPGLLAVSPPRPDVTVREFLWLLAAGTVFWAAMLAMHDLRLAATTVAGREAFLGQSVSVREALTRTVERAGALLGTTAVQMILYVFLIGLAALPAAGLVAAAVLRTEGQALWLLGALFVLAVFEVPTVLWLMLRYSLVAQVVMLERVSFVRALRRSAELMRGRASTNASSKWTDNSMLRASIVLAVTLAVNVAVASLMSVPHLLVNFAYGNNPLTPNAVDPLAVPAYAIIPIELADAALESAVAPFWLLAMMVFYFDLRIRKEGFDLEVLAETLAKKPAA